MYLCLCIEMLDAKDASSKKEKGKTKKLKYKRRRICVEFTSSWKKRT